MSQKDVILALLGEGRKTTAEIAARIGTSTGTVRQHMRRMKAHVARGDDHRWRLVGPATRSKRPESPLLDRIMELLREGPLRSSVIATRLGATPPAIKRQLYALRDAGDVVQTGRTHRSTWSLPADAPAEPPPGRRKPPAPPRAHPTEPNRLVAMLLTQREHHARNLDRIDRMLAIAREE